MPANAAFSRWKFSLVALLLLPLTSCIRVSTVPAPDGRKALFIECPREDQCLERAAKECRGPYDLIKSGSNVSGNMGRNSGGVSTTHTLTVQCKNFPDGAPPDVE